MFKNVIAAGIGVVMALLVTMSITEAATGTISGTSIKQCVCFSATGAIVSCSGTFAVKRCSIDIASILKSLGNVSSGPNAVAAAYEVQLLLQNALVFCVNKSGNAEPSNGTPFENIIVVQIDAITNKRIDKNGKALSDLFFTDDNLLSALFATTDICPNKNWSGRVFVEDLQALGTLFTQSTASSCVLNPGPGQPIQTTGCTIGDALGVTCTAPGTATVTAPFEYDCTTVCHNDDSGFPVCPAHPGESPFPPAGT